MDDKALDLMMNELETEHARIIRHSESCSLRGRHVEAIEEIRRAEGLHKAIETIKTHRHNFDTHVGWFEAEMTDVAKAISAARVSDEMFGEKEEKKEK